MSSETNELLEQIVAEHGIQALPNWRDYLPAYNIKPTSQVPVILHSRKLAADVITTARWSLVPTWSKELSTKFPTFNARSEDIRIDQRLTLSAQHVNLSAWRLDQRRAPQ